MSQIDPQEYAVANGMPITIRSATPDDAEALTTIAEEFISEGKYNITEVDEGLPNPDQQRGWIIKHLNPQGYLLLLAEINGAVVGMLSFQNGARRRIAHRGSFHVWVVRDWMNYGVDRALTEALLNWATDSPLIEKVGVEVFSTHARALELYQNLGFVEEGRRPYHVKLDTNDYVDTYLLYKLTLSADRESAEAEAMSES